MAKDPTSPPTGHGDGLNPKQARFVEEYLTDLHATQAAIRAGYSPKTAESQGSRLLSVAKIARAIAARQDERAKDVGITQARVLREVALLAFSDVTHYQVDAAGKVTLTGEAPKGAQRAISSIKHRVTTDKDGGTSHEVELRLWNKPEAIKLSGRHVGLFGETEAERPPTNIVVYTGMRPPPELAGEVSPAANVGPNTTSTGETAAQYSPPTKGNAPTG